MKIVRYSVDRYQEEDIRVDLVTNDNEQVSVVMKYELDTTSPYLVEIVFKEPKLIKKALTPEIVTVGTYKWYNGKGSGMFEPRHAEIIKGILRMLEL